MTNEIKEINIAIVQYGIDELTIEVGGRKYKLNEFDTDFEADFVIVLGEYLNRLKERMD